MNRDSVRRRWTGVVRWRPLLQAFLIYAAASLQKVVFVFRLQQRISFIFVAKERYFSKTGLMCRLSRCATAWWRFPPWRPTKPIPRPRHWPDPRLHGRRLDLVFIAGIINRLDGDFVAAPKILTPADLKGKNLGVQSIGGGIWTFSMLALDHWGLVPERDKIQFRILGDHR
jgi:hypothetical protein